MEPVIEADSDVASDDGTTDVAAAPKTTKTRPVEVRDFRFATEQELYGFVNVGAKICQVIPGTSASMLGVRPGWYIAYVNREALPGAMQKLVRREPIATTDVVRDLLREGREEAVRQDGFVRITFWTSPAPFNEDREEDERLHADSVEELKKILMHKYGSLVAAWDTALDTDKSGQLSYSEFVAACRALGFNGSLKQVYRELDRDNSGSISVMELDPSCAVDVTKGRCLVCTLPNPCPRHGEDEQKRVSAKERQRIIQVQSANTTTRGFMSMFR
eukprot:TRINITY_DN55302_c0_g1_i1.p1 TRINITY_DN55302_c0_g1~~TRINITY_DN55302_c0_g1_i1.p1  ORF type:complete len:295 (-),score=40.70 TRINITY_DN55302_c0_g1_i1:220-1041(-)